MLDILPNITEQKFLDFIHQHHLCYKNEKILLAVSGGIDSMVMFHLFIKTGFNISVAHANFGLRGAESDKEELFVKEICKSKKIQFLCKHFNTKQYAVNHHISVEMAARELRYKWFSDLCKEHDFNKVAIAHHKNDHVETILLNLIRGTALRGLRGLKPVRENIIRPLLCLSRQEIEDYATAENLAFLTDSSNRNSNFHRNRIRLKVIPELLKINPNLLETITHNSNILEKTENFLDEKLDEISIDIYIRDNDTITIFLDKLQKTGHQDLILAKILEPFALTYARFIKIKELINAQTGKYVKFGDYLYTKDRYKLIISKIKKSLNDNISYAIDLNILNNEHEKIQIEFLDEVNYQELKNTRYAFLDLGKLKSPLILRKWKSSDRFIPFGMKQEKKISDFLTDIKYPAHLRKNVHVLLSGNKIVWVAGLRIAEPFKVTQETKKIVKISLKNN